MTQANVDLTPDGIAQTLTDLAETVTWLERYTDAYAVLAWEKRKKMLRNAYVTIRLLQRKLEEKQQ